MSIRLFSYSVLLLGLALPALWSSPARAQPRAIWVLPTQSEPLPGSVPVDLAPLARRLDGVLGEAVLDFGFSPVMRQAPAKLEEETLTELAHDAWLVLPRLTLRGGDISLRLSVVPRGSQVLLVRAQRLEPGELEVRSLGMLRQLLEPSLDVSQPNCPEPSQASPAQVSTASRSHSEGRAVLALHAAALGGYLGFSLQRASGSDDARLTYPLAALGAGVGVGSAMIVSEEWDISVARAWFLGASIVWPGLATSLIVNVDEQASPGKRQMLGLVGAVGGLTLATAGLALGEVTDGGAALTHSGAALGLLLGGLVEMTLQGDTGIMPRKGMGWGALTGVVVSGAVASQLEVPSATDLLFVDLSALLGGLAGAALGTPILVSQEASPTRDRIWLSGIMAGTLAGAGVGYWVTQSGHAAASENTTLNGDSHAILPSSSSFSAFSLRPQLGWQGRPLGLGVAGQW
jgi:hypothetical protein